MSPLALLLTTLDGVTSSSVGDLVRGGTMPTAGRQSGQWVPQRGTQGCPLLRGARPRPFSEGLGPAHSSEGLGPAPSQEARLRPFSEGLSPTAAEVEAQVGKRFLGCERAPLWAPFWCEALLLGDSGAEGTFVESRLLLCLNLLPGGHKADVSRGVQGGCLLGVSLALLVASLGLGRKDEKMDGWTVLQ